MTILRKKRKEKDESSINQKSVDDMFAHSVHSDQTIPRIRDPRQISMEYLSRFFFFRVEEDMMRFGQRFMLGVDHPLIQSTRLMMFGAFEEAMSLKNIGDRHRWSEAHIERLVSGFFEGMSIWIKIARDELKFKDILAIRDIEQRMVALKRYGVEKILHDAQAQLISKSKRGNELYKIPAETRIFSQDAYYLKYSDPSTGRIYISGVPPQMGETKSADACMAWKHGLSTEAYQLLHNEA